MGTFQIVAKASAAKEFDRLPEPIRDRFQAAFAKLEDDPFRSRSGADIRRLQGRQGEWGLRVGSFRGIYEVDGHTIRFLQFGPRPTVYR